MKQGKTWKNRKAPNAPAKSWKISALFFAVRKRRPFLLRKKWAGIFQHWHEQREC